MIYTYTTKAMNSYGHPLVLEQLWEGYYRFRQDIDKSWGGSMNDCGTKEDVVDRLVWLIEMENENIRHELKCPEWPTWVEIYKTNRKVYKELLGVLQNR